MQYHLFSKNQPENLAWMERIRRVMDDYDNRATVGEMGENHHAIRMMGDYTQPGRLHQCYSFELMGYDFTPAFFRGKIEEFFAGAPNGWPMWAFSNHDVVRHVSRWKERGVSQDALAKVAASMLLSFEGSICLWQGEEMGQTDTILSFDELTDPQGINFWPEPIGRDNTRTPMVWDGSAQGGFSTGTPWLPVKALQLARNVAAQEADAGSVLHHYRRALAFRRQMPALVSGKSRFHDVPDPLLAFTRGEGDGAVLCVFNLGPQARNVALTGKPVLVGPCDATLSGQNLALPGNGWAWITGAVV